MNNKNINTQVYAQKVELLLRLMPIIMDEGVFAVHGGTAINLFLKDLPRYSVDIDLTHIPLSDRQTSIADINKHLASICEKAVKAFKGMHITPNYSTCKLLCEYRGKQVKVEVNQTKRGIVSGPIVSQPLSEKAQEEFGLYCEGLIFCLLGSDRPIHESFAPRLIDQREAMANQFDGMTEIPFTYQEFEDTRARRIADVNALITDADKRFLVSFEKGTPAWDGYEFEYLKEYPSVKWKLLNLAKLAKQNPQKLEEEAAKLEEIFKTTL